MKTSKYKAPKYQAITYYSCPLSLIIGSFFMLTAQALPQHDKAPIADTTVPAINIKECRLANYMVEFDLKRGNANVGNATRGLKQLSQSNDMSLFSSLTASMVFMKFTQKEYSVITNYDDLGFYSSQYIKQAKKPFKKEEKETYSVNQMVDEHPTNLLDPLSVYDHLRELSCSGLRSNITLKVKEKKDIQPYYFEYKGERNLALPMGPTKTILFVRTRKTSRRETSIWFNKDYHFLPVKIEQQKDGYSQAVLTVKSISATKVEF